MNTEIAESLPWGAEALRLIGAVVLISVPALLLGAVLGEMKHDGKVALILFGFLLIASTFAFFVFRSVLGL